MTLTAGVVAVQGDVSEHADAIRRAAAAHDESVEVVEIRRAGLVPDCDLLLMPGGESTAISRLLRSEGIAPEIVAHVEGGRPVLATCAGLIVAARDVVERSSTGDRDQSDSGDVAEETSAGSRNASRSGDAGDDRVENLDLLDVRVERNAFGRQRDSFEAALPVAGLDEPFPAVFIRAPLIADPGGAEVLAEWDGHPVAVRDGPVVGTSFHPELTPDVRLHSLAFFDR